MNFEFNNLETAEATLQPKGQTSLDYLTARQKEAVALLKHSHIVPATMVRAANVGGAVADKWHQKFVCLIATVGVDGSPDGNYRIVATSDLHQVHHLEAVKKALKKASPSKANAQMATLAKLLAAKGIDLSDLLAETEETETEEEVDISQIEM